MSDEQLPASSGEEERREIPLLYESSQPVDKLGVVLQILEDQAESVHDAAKFLELLSSQIVKAMGADLILLFGWNEEAREWTLFSYQGMPKDFGKNGFISRAWQSLPSIVLQQGPNLFSNGISKDPRFIGQVIRGMNIQSFAGSTLRCENKVLGSIALGFSKPEALTSKDQETFLMISKLIAPFLSHRMRSGGEKEKQPFTLFLDMNGRVLSVNNELAQFLGYEKEIFHKAALSQFLTPKGMVSYNESIDAVKAQKKALSCSLEVVKRGNLKGILSAQLALVQKDGKNSIEVTAFDATGTETLEKELVQKNTEIEILESLFSNLSRSLKEDDLFKVALEKTLSLMNVEGGYILRLDQNRERLFLIAQQGLSADKAQRLEKQGAKIGENVIGKILEKKAPTLFASEEPKMPLKKRFVGDEGILSYMGMQIKSSGQIWGTLSLFSRNRILTQDDLEILGFVGKEIGFAIDAMRMIENAKQRVEDLTIINEVSQSITKSLHLEQLLSSVANSLTKMIGASNCYIFSVDDKRNVLYGVAASDQRGDAIRKVEIKTNENTLVSLTAREQHPFMVENAPQDPRISKKWVDVFKSRSLLSIPLITKERVIGVVLLDETRYFRQFTKEEIQKVVALASQVSIAIENATLYQAVTKHMERLQTLSSAIVNIQEEERRRIAQELHNEAGQALTGIKMSLEWVEKELGTSEKAVKERIQEVRSQVTKTLEDLRRLSSDLRPAILDESGLIPTLRWYIEEYSKRTKTAVHLQTTGTQKRFSAKVETLFYRIIQEALTNVAKHAQAESVIVSLEKKDVHVHLYITDDGKGFEVKRYFSSPPMIRRGLGILGMKERVELAGGTFFIDSDPGQGTRISIKIPIVKRGS